MDLVAADARYHKLCHKKFYLPLAGKTRKRGRPTSSYVQDAMEYIYSQISENRDESQFLLSDLIEQIEGDEVPDMRTIKENLTRHYGDKIVITEGMAGRRTFICFKEDQHKILHNNWYNEKKRTLRRRG